MPDFSVSGLASGIDSKAIVESLIFADRAPARVLESKRSLAQQRLDAVRQFNTRMLALRDAADNLRASTVFTATSATSSKTDALTVTSDASASSGTYLVSVSRLAAAGEVASVAKTTKTGVTVGDIVLKLNGSDEVTIANTATDLDGIASTINAAGKGVNATVVNDGSGYRLMLRSTATGDATDIQYVRGALAGDDVFRNGLGVDATTRVTDGVDAQIRLGGSNGVGGLPVTSATNTVTGAIPGVTLTLKSVANDITVTVGQDTSGIKTKVKALVDTYNAAYDYLQANGKYDTVTRRAGPLFGEYDLRRGLEDAYDAINGSVTGQPSGYGRLQEVGIALGPDGRLTFGETAFDDKLKSNQAAMKTLATTAVGAAYAKLNSLTEPTVGAFAGEMKSLETAIADITTRVAAWDARLETRKKRYQSQFLAMETSIAKLKNQSGQYLSQLSQASSSK